MLVPWYAALLTGICAALGVLGGAILTGLTNSRIENQKKVNEEAGRWTADRRMLYARYVTLCESMLRQVDAVAVFLRYDSSGRPDSDTDEQFVSEGLLEYHARWDEELQSVLEELQLIAGDEVADLADRVSGALMELTSPIELRESFTSYYPAWFQTKDLLAVLRNAMRVELGVGRLSASTFVRSADWPWLPDRPPAESYVQRHSSSEKPSSNGDHQDGDKADGIGDGGA